MKVLGQVAVGQRYNRFTGKMEDKMRTRIECQCGGTLVLSDATNQCVCGQRFNMSGQKLRSRAAWV
jgi:hypothetical protein